uniref:CSON007996 protein n=1 Tax=Culicoides sonorensis TaxID=179676 RepID=A0A336MW02_CULSO
MSFNAQGVQGVVTHQPTSNVSQNLTGLEDVHNAGGWIPAIERALLKLSQNPEFHSESSAPSAPPLEGSQISDAPPPYSVLYPESQTDRVFDSHISRCFQTNSWRDMTINGNQIFKDLSENDMKMLEDALSTLDATVYSLKITLELAENQKCSSFNEFLKMFTFVKNYMKFKQEKELKSTVPQSEINQTTRYDQHPGMAQVDGAPPQSRHTDPMNDPFCCWLWFMHAPPTHGTSCPCCFCCFDCSCCSNGSDIVTDANQGSSDCCTGCDDCGECDCGDCDCGGCDCGGF